MSARIGLLRAVDPPPAQGPRSSVVQRIGAEVVPKLRGKPDTWFVVAEFDGRSSASTAAARLRRLWPQVEWTSRRPPNATAGSHLYARYRTRKEPAR